MWGAWIGRFWKSGADQDKLAAYSTLYTCLVTVAQLMAPLEQAGLFDNVRQLVIVPHAELHYLPFAALLRGRDKNEFLEAIHQPYDLILCDYSMPGFHGQDALELAKRECPQAPFIFLSGTLGEEAAVESLKSGAVDYILKDRLGRLVPAVRLALTVARDRALALTYADYSSTVVPYLEAAVLELYGSENAWLEMQLRVVERLQWKEGQL